MTTTFEKSQAGHGDEEYLRVEEGLEGVDERIVALAPLHAADQERQVVPGGARLVVNMSVVSGDTV